ncbi:MAG: hypothetical protein QOK16_2334 [Solirubrobacteraceae bacterium]|jgi:hypothetical protein|nr:hypothetical protein [Solirubrobacteraceae bacterium]MEA2187323.1 hypothetical protein [Solirubrobacteraceae bacterium]
MARTTTTLLRIALVTAVLVCVVVTSAGARVIAQSVAGFEGGPALGSDGRVVVGERRGNGALGVLAIAPNTNVATELTAFGPLADPATFSTLGIAGTGGIVTATRKILSTKLPLPFDVRTLTVLPTVAPIAGCSGPPRIGPNLEAAGGEGFIATIRDDCGAAPSVVRIRTANATIAIPLAIVPDEHTFAPAMFSLRAAGPMVGWIETHYPGGLAASSAVVARAATGQVLLRAPLPGDPFFFSALAADGTVVFISGSCAMSVVSPAAPALRTFVLPAELCPMIGPDPSPVSVTGGRVVYGAKSSGSLTADGYAVTDLQGAAHALAEARSGPRGALSQTAFDGHTAYLVRVDCDADRLLAVDTDADATMSLAPVAPSTGERCPVRRANRSRLRVAPDAHVRIALRCKHGCRGTLRLVEQRHGRRERPVGQVHYVTGPGTVVVRAPIARYARMLAGCSGALRVAAILHPIGTRNGPPTSDLGRGLGTFTINSRSRCRRTGGPAFTRRQPGPRP